MSIALNAVIRCLGTMHGFTREKPCTQVVRIAGWMMKVPGRYLLLSDLKLTAIGDNQKRPVMKTPARTLAEINKSRRLEAHILGEVSRRGAKSTDQLLRRLDWYGSLESPNLDYVQARVMCTQAAEKIRELEEKINAVCDCP